MDGLQRIPVWIGGFLLLLVCCFGVVHAGRAAASFCVYYQTKYGPSDTLPEVVAARCERAHVLYPFNYHFCIWTAEHAWYRRFAEGGAELSGRVDIAHAWCDIGLSLNPWKSQLRLLKTRLLWRDSAEMALQYWRAYVDWDFWNPYHHVVLAELYADTGDFASALRELTWVRGSEQREAVIRRITEAWKDTAALPAGTAIHAR